MKPWFEFEEAVRSAVVFAVHAALIVVVVSGLAACGSGGTDGEPSGPGDGGGGTAPPDGPVESAGAVTPVESGESWTFLVYMVADNDLEAFGLLDLQEMMEVGSGGGLQILVQADRAETDYEGAFRRRTGTSPRGNLEPWTSARRLRIVPGDVEELADLGEVNMGDPATLADFIAFGVETAPADRYALVFWDHGGAWPGFGGDESTEDHDLLTLAELVQGLDDGITAAGIGGFSLLGFDACLMATYETAVAVRPYGEVLLASEELEPGHGWDYTRLELLANDPTAPPAALGKALLDGFVAQAEASGTGADLTLSLTDLVALDTLEAAWNGLAQALDADAAEVGPALGRARGKVREYGKVPQDPSRSTHQVDMGDLVASLAAEDTSRGAAAAKVQQALKAVVLERHAGPQSEGSTGLSIYFPPLASLFAAAYAEVPGVETWRGFLQAFYGAAAGVVGGPSIAAADHLGTLVLDEGLLVLSAPLAAGAAAAITVATTYAGVVDEAANQVILVADLPAGWDEDEVAGAWDGSVVTVTQGGVAAYAYASYELAQDDAVAVSIPFSYVAPGSAEGELCVLRTVFSAAGEVLSSVYYLFSEAGVAELTPLPGSQLLPLVQVVDLGTQSADWAPTSETPLSATEPIALGTEPLPTGTVVYLEVDVADFAGNSDYVYNTATLGSVPGPGPDPDPEPGPEPDAGGCGAIDDVGVCEGFVLSYCDGGELQTYDCFDLGCTGCDFVEGAGYYDCVGCPE